MRVLRNDYQSEKNIPSHGWNFFFYWPSQARVRGILNRDHQFFVCMNDENSDPAGIRGNHARIGCVFIHSSIQTCPPSGRRRAWTETFADSGHCKSRTSFHRVPRGERLFRPRSFRRWGLWSRISFLSWSCSFLGCCCHCLLIPVFTLFVLIKNSCSRSSVSAVAR